MAAAEGWRLDPSWMVGDGIFVVPIPLIQSFFDGFRTRPPADLGGSAWLFGLGDDIEFGCDSRPSGVGNGCDRSLYALNAGNVSSRNFFCSSCTRHRSSRIVRRSISNSLIRSSLSLI